MLALRLSLRLVPLRMTAALRPEQIRSVRKILPTVDDAWRADPSCRWIMNAKTLGSLYGVLDKMGRPVVNFVEGAPTILGIPVLWSPSMDNIGASKVLVLLGACWAWVSRLVISGVDDMGIMMYKESAGVIENGFANERGIQLLEKQEGALHGEVEGRV